MCMDCFQDSVHKSHRYKVSVNIKVNLKKKKRHLNVYLSILVGHSQIVPPV